MIAFHGLAEVVSDLRGQAADEFIQGMKDQTVRAGENVATTARAAAPRGPHTPRFADSIRSRTTKDTAAKIEVTVEARGRNQSPLGAILEFGTAKSAPHPVVGDSFRDETPVWLTHLANLYGNFL